MEIDARIDKLDARIDKLDAKLDAKIDGLHQELHNTTRWIIGTIVTATGVTVVLASWLMQ